MADLADLDGGAAGACEISVFRQLEEGGLTSVPDEPAVIVLHRDGNHLSELVDGTRAPATNNKYLSWTFSQLHRAALRIAGGLVAEGVNTKAPMVLFLPTGIETCVLLWTLAILRMPLAPLDPDMLTAPRHEELKTVLSSLEPAVVVLANTEHEAHLEQQASAAGVPNFLTVVTDGTGTKSSIGLLDLVAKGSQKGYDADALLEKARKYEPDDMAYYAFTSGTSVGKPKGCPHKVRLAAHGMRNFMSVDRPGSRGPSPSFSPIFRVSGIYSPLRSWSRGEAQILPGISWTTDGLLDAVEQFKCATFGATPNMLQTLVSDPTFAKRDFSSVDMVVLGADAITPAAIATAQKAVPHAWVAVLYGMTEGACLLSWPYADTPVSAIPLFGEICPMGKIKPTVRMRIRDVDTGEIAKRNQAGEIIISGAPVITNYLGGRHPESFFDDDVARWYCTGDLGMINDDGLVYVLGRLKDIIKRRGATLVPSAMESVLLKYTGSLATVVAVPSAEYGHEPFAVVKDFGGKTEADMRDEVVRMCDSRHVLAGVVDVKQIGLQDFPLNATGKIVKTEVQTALLAYLDGQRAGA